LDFRLTGFEIVTLALIPIFLTMKFRLERWKIKVIGLAWMGLGLCANAAQTALPAPTLKPQDQGWCYTRTGYAAGAFKIENQIAVLAGSRYGFVFGLKVPLDDQNPLHAEALLRDGQVYVPPSFAGYLALKSAPAFTPPPVYLRDRWVYDLPRPSYTPPASVRTIQVNGHPWVDFADVGNALGLHVFQDDSGLVSIGRKPDFDFTTHELTLHDSVVSLFDSPEKIADSVMALKYLPAPPPITPAPKPPNIPRAAYNLGGFNFKLLGSAIPPPGVYPRLLFSPDDLAGIQQRLQQVKTMQMSIAEMQVMFRNSWWDPTTLDGQMFAKLVKGQPTDFTSEGHGASIFSSNVNYPTNCLVSMALYCLLAADDEHGQQAANAICNYYKALEPRLDNVLASSASEFAFTPELAGFSTSQWKGVDDLVSGLDLALALDFGGHWMTPEQKDLMARIIAKATYGRRATPGNGLDHLLALAAIQGLPGFDAEAYAADAELAQSFLDWGLDERGQLTAEGAQAGDLQFQVLAMIVLARRGDNLWGNPHWRNFLKGASSSPTASQPDATDGGPYDSQTILEFHAFYPDNKTADQILSLRFPKFKPSALDLTLFSAQLANETAAHMRGLKLRLPGPSYPGFVSPVLYDTDWEPPALGE
jgi:hypothetical protein